MIAAVSLLRRYAFITVTVVVVIGYYLRWVVDGGNAASFAFWPAFSFITIVIIIAVVVVVTRRHPFESRS